MSPADIGLVINTHLHFDHCGQNAVFKHAPGPAELGARNPSCTSGSTS
jgi:glyoxylase-like metal-dependent hydrolase (beta-lactamase superfamily II)